MHLDERGWTTHGVDNNMRRDALRRGRRHDGEPANVSVDTTRRFTHHELDIRDREGVARVVRRGAPTAHRARRRATVPRPRRPETVRRLRDQRRSATLNLLEAARSACPEIAVRVPLDEQGLRRRAERACRSSSSRPAGTTRIPALHDGIDESCPIDRSHAQPLRRLEGARPTCSSRSTAATSACRRSASAAGCLTGSNHAGVELHGFLALPRHAPCRDGRDVPHLRLQGQAGPRQHPRLRRLRRRRRLRGAPASRRRLQPRRRARRQRLDARGDRTARGADGRTLDWEYVDEPRRGDHICYISDLRRFRADYPSWEPEVSLDDILAELAAADGA